MPFLAMGACAIFPGTGCGPIAGRSTMLIRHVLRTFEKTLLRPIARQMKRVWRRVSGPGRGRVGHLERRVEELEAAVRELTGLAYLRLVDDEDSSCDDRMAA